VPLHTLKLTAALVSGAALGVGTVGAWYVVTPKMTVEAMADAAASKDGARLVQYMDMKALRADMRRRAAIVISDRYPLGRTKVVIDPRRVTEALAGKVIDEVFSPRGTDRMLARNRVPTAPGDVAYVILRGGPNQFTARFDSPRRVDLLFSRHGAGWKLSGIAARPRTRSEQII
jgi:hypothetical protein